MPGVDQSAQRRRGRRFQSLSGRILFFVVLSTGVTAGTVGWIAVRSTQDFLRGEIDRAFPAALAHTGSRVAAVLDDAEADLARAAAVIESRCRREGPRSCRSNEATLEPTLDALRPRLGALDTLAVVNTSGDLLAASGGEAAGLEARLVRGIPIDQSPHEIVPAPHRGRFQLAMRRPLGGAGGGAPWAWLHGWVGSERLASELASEALASEAEILLVDAAGRIVGHPAGARRLGPRINASALAHPRTVTEYRSQSGLTMLGSSLPLAPGLHLVVEAPRKAVYAPVSELLTRVVVIDAAIVLILALLAHQIAGAIAQPIRALSEGARRIAEGDLEIRIDDGAASDEIGLLTRTFNDMIQRLRDTQRNAEAATNALQRRNEELQGANEVLEQLSITDGLTKLHNHRFFQDHLTREIKRVRRTGEPVSMLLIDIDDFKRLNDRLGHAAGDELLKGIARSLNASVRESDFLARYGGEEFVVVAANTHLSGAIHLAEKVRTDVAESSFVVDESMQVFKITVSIGVAEYCGDRKAFFQCADRALYRAKAEGKNCVVADQQEHAPCDLSAPL
jgi:diguanylate cyclase (GGDEF)-like protein